MKTTIYSTLIFLSMLCQAQRVDVLIVGTAHYFKDEYQALQKFDEIQEDLLKYQPDIICIEAIPVDDTLSLQEIWPKNMKRAESLRSQLKDYSPDSTTESQLLGAKYYAKYDFWNAYYYWDSLDVVDQTPGPFTPYHRGLKNSEYGNIVFPAARKLEKAELIGIDYRAGEKAFLDNNNKVMKKLLFNFKWKPIRTYLKIQKKYKRAEEEGQLMSFINGDEFQGAFSDLIEELPSKLPRSTEARDVRDYWHKRNRIMADRIHQTATASSAEKILVTVGSAHVGLIKYYLEQLGCNVTTYGQFLNTKNN